MSDSGIFLFLYNIAFLILYCIPLASGMICYMQTKRPFFLSVVVLFFFYIVDELIIYMTEFFSEFSHIYDTLFMSVPTVKTVIFLGSLGALLWINEILLKRGAIKSFRIGLVALCISQFFVAMLPDVALKVWLYYTLASVYTLLLGVYGLYIHKKYPEDFQTSLAKQHRIWLLLCTILSIAIVAEDTIVIFFRDNYNPLDIDIQNRSFTQDLFSAVICVYTIILIYHELKSLLNLDSSEKIATIGNVDLESAQKDSRDQTSSGEAEIYSKFYCFCKKYQLTAREQDILLLLLHNKNNQEISEELAISVGTAKTHAHNIFSKIGVSKRQQLLDKYQTYSSS